MAAVIELPTAKNKTPEVLTPKDVQDILGIGRRQTYELLENPPFHTVRIGRRIIIPKVPFYNWLNGQEEQG